MSNPHLTESQRLAYLSAMQTTSWLPLADKVNTLGPVWQEDTGQPDAINQATTENTSVLKQTYKEANTSVKDNAPVQDNASTLDEASVKEAMVALKTAIQVVPQSAQAPSSPNQTKTAETSTKTSHAIPTTNPSAATLAITALNIQPPSAVIKPINLNISLYIYAHKAGVLVINEAPSMSTGAISESIIQLQTAIVAAMSAYDKQWTIQHTNFEWPIVPGPNGDNSLAGAQQAFSYTLDKFIHTIRKLDIHTPSAEHTGTSIEGIEGTSTKILPTNSVGLYSKLLLLGDRAGELIPTLSKLTHGSVAGPDLLTGTQWEDMQVVRSHSLHQLMRVPEKKAQTWQHLQPLVTKLPA